MFGKLTKILLFSLLFLACQQKTIIIEDTSGYIAFNRMPEAGNIVDYNIWLINTKTGEEIRITGDLGHWEYYPVWMSNSELLCLIEPQEKTMTETDIVYFNFATGKIKILDFWTWEKDPAGEKFSIDSSNNIYYADDGRDAVYVLSLKEKRAKPIEIISSRNIKQFGLENASNPVISPDGSKLLLVACDTTKYRRLHNKEERKFYYDIYLYNLKAHYKKDALTRSTHGDYDNDDPVWVNNDSIIFTSNRDGNYDLYLMNITNKNTERLTFSDDTEDTRAAVSPDGKKIAYSRYDKELKKIEIWLMDLETKKAWFLTKGSDPDWSPAR